MRPAFHSTTARSLTALAVAGILAFGMVTAPPDTAHPRAEVRAVALASASTVAVAPASVRRTAASTTADDTTTPPDFLAFAASILEYLNSLGLGAGPGLAAIALSGAVVAFAATAYAWNGFADTVNPGLRFLHIPRVPKFPVCFAGQSCAGSSSAQARIKAASRGPAKSTSATGSTGRSTASSGRPASAPTAAKAAGPKKSTPSPSGGKGSSKRIRAAAGH